MTKDMLIMCAVVALVAVMLLAALPETEDLVLAIVSGKPQSNIMLIDAPEIASYWRDDDGWLIDAYPAWDNPKVTYWMPIPEIAE